MKNVRNRLKIKFVKKDDYRGIIKQQSKWTFNGIHKSYENCDSYTFKQNEVLFGLAYILRIFCIKIE